MLYLLLSVTNDMQLLLEILEMGNDLKSYMGAANMHLVVSADMGGSGLFDYRVIQTAVDNTTTNILQVLSLSL